MSQIEKSMPDGKRFERKLLYPHSDPRLDNLDAIDRKTVKKLDYHDAILECINNNPNGYKDEQMVDGKLKKKNETFDPPASWTNDIHYRIAKILELENWQNLKIFPALGTSADFHHGIDFIVQFTDSETGDHCEVTVDITMKNDKPDLKADVLVNPFGARANGKYRTIEGKKIPAHSQDNREMETRKDKLRREAVAGIIADVIPLKLAEVRRIKSQTRVNIFSQFNTLKKPGSNAGTGSQDLARAG